MLKNNSGSDYNSQILISNPSSRASLISNDFLLLILPYESEPVIWLPLR